MPLPGMMKDFELTNLYAQLISDKFGASALAVIHGDGSASKVGVSVPSKDATTVTLGAVVDTTQTVSVQLKDKNGDNVVGVQLLDVFWTLSSTGASLDTLPGDLAGVSITSGALFDGDALKADGTGTTGVGRALTNATGALVFEVDNAGAGAAFVDRFAVRCSDGLVVSAAMAVPTA